MNRTFLRSIGTVLSLGVILVLFFASPARAETALLQCTGTGGATYSPGLTLAAQNTNLTAVGTYVCVGVPMSLVFATFDGTAAGFFSCTSGAGTFAVTIGWSDGQSSEATGNFLLTVRGGVAVTVLNGTVNSGRFPGATVAFTFQVLLVDNPLGCSAPPGIRSTSGTATFTLVSVL